MTSTPTCTVTVPSGRLSFGGVCHPIYRRCGELLPCAKHGASRTPGTDA